MSRLMSETLWYRLDGRPLARPYLKKAPLKSVSLLVVSAAVHGRRIYATASPPILNVLPRRNGLKRTCCTAVRFSS